MTKPIAPTVSERGVHRSVKLVMGAALLVLLSFVAGLQYDQVYGKACESAEKDCATYKMAFGFFVWIGKGLDDHNAAVAAVAACLVAAFTFTLWRSTDRLWKAGEAQLRHLQDNAARQLRAYVTLRANNWKQADDTADMIVWRLKFRNGGCTPAYDVRYRATVKLLNRETDEIPTFPVAVIQDSGAGILGPGQSIRLQGFHRPIAAAEWKTLKDHPKKHCLAVHGTLWYRDAFGVTRYTNFHHEIAWKDNARLRIIKSYGNDAT